MVCRADVLSHNASLQDDGSRRGLVAVFVGATSGIGLATLRVLASQLPSPRIYVVGRSKSRFARELADIQERNPAAAVTFIESEISLLRSVGEVCAEMARSETSLDMLYLSPGYLGFGGPHYTEEGLDTCFALSLYCRMRFVQGLLPLLLAARRPRVLSVLAGGHERPLWGTEDGDLGLRAHGGRSYTAARAVDQVTTLHTLAFAHLASLHPTIAFLHSYPGWVATDFLANLLGTLGVGGRLLAHAVTPLYRRVAISLEESGQWQAFHATSARYPSRDMIRRATFDVNNVSRCHTPCSGLYLVLEDGETSTARDVLGPLEADGWPERVWQHVEEVFEETNPKAVQIDN